MNPRFRTVLKTHCYASALTPHQKNYGQSVLERLSLLLLEDIDKGDVTTSALLPSSRKVTAKLVAKGKGVLAGMQELKFFLIKKFKHVKLSDALPDGTGLKKGAVLCLLNGKASDILQLERTILNFLQRMSGVATSAAVFAEKCAKYPVLVCPTRKTPWGVLDKRACAVGGAGTHRLNLHDAVLVKDTHLDLLSHDFKKVGQKLKSARSLGRFVEIEVESVREAWEAADILVELQKNKGVPCFIMLDNMKTKTIISFVTQIRSRKKYSQIFLEASGGITLKNIKKYAQTGVDILSVGSITHSAPALDISLKIVFD